jgi:hypothetical protein
VKEKLEPFNLCGDIVVQYGNAGETPSRFWPLLVGEDEWCFLSGSCDWLIAAGVEALIQAEERGDETIDPDGLLLRLGAEIGKLDRRSTGRQQQRYKMLASLHLLARLGQLDNALHTHNPRRFHFLRWRDGKVKDVIAHHRPGEGIPHYGFDRRRRFRGFESISFAAAGAPLPTGWSVAFSPGPCRCSAAADGSTTEASRRRCPIHGTGGLPAVPSPRTFDELIRIMRNGGDID